MDADNTSQFEVNKDETKHYLITKKFSHENLYLLEKPIRIPHLPHMYTHFIAFLLNSFTFSCTSASQMGRILRFCEDEDRFHIPEFIKLKGGIKKLLNIPLVLAFYNVF